MKIIALVLGLLAVLLFPTATSAVVPDDPDGVSGRAAAAPTYGCRSNIESFGAQSVPGRTILLKIKASCDRKMRAIRVSARITNVTDGDERAKGSKLCRDAVSCTLYLKKSNPSGSQDFSAVGLDCGIDFSCLTHAKPYRGDLTSATDWRCVEAICMRGTGLPVKHLRNK